VKKKTNIGVKKIAEVVKDIRIAMMSTVDSRGQTTASMATQNTPFNGTLWFFNSKQFFKG